jgi:imidazolonepropionase-like amidohydrolase
MTDAAKARLENNQATKKIIASKFQTLNHNFKTGESAMTAKSSTNTLLFIHANLVDGNADHPLKNHQLLIRDGRIAAVSSGTIDAPDAIVIDLAGKTLMPGLIDCHVHVVSSSANLGANALLPDSLVAARAAKLMNEMLLRGFTTVRDVGGADYGLKQAQEEGLINGPRLVICGKALSQTGGHTDYRGRFDRRNIDFYAQKLGALGRICNGIDEVRSAAREEIKGGAQFIFGATTKGKSLERISAVTETPAAAQTTTQ